ncbi:LysR family transcriptional regulator [Salinibacterium sp. M195]|uniref:LysR substrate-binding domain-containing protein n=1 Tax=Salinibacterium sp. M195 TaxID=2583374 RepID=UPI001C637A20|nr:LysR family transcriptional regulator [Salinibacterium sp. M195]QYH35161.1 LysR family transcriptional regulator [Salinibacterium sp. M195]
MQFTLRQVEIFVAVAEMGHFGRAAENLHISQPTVSQEVSRLERALGLALLDRSGRSATLTQAGQELAAEGRSLLNHADQVVKKVQLFEPTRFRTIRLVASPSIVNRLLPTVISKAEQSLPSVRIEDIPVDTGGVTSALIAEHADIGVGRFLDDTEGYQIESLTEEKVFVAISRKHPLADAARLELPELGDLPLLLWPREQNPAYFDYLLEICTSRGLSPLLLVSPPRIVGSRLYLLSESRAFSLVSAALIGHLPEDLTAIPLAQPATLPLQMQWRSNDTRPQLTALRALIREVASAL